DGFAGHQRHRGCDLVRRRRLPQHRVATRTARAPPERQPLTRRRPHHQLPPPDL
ncbi:MAG: hypothetical protein AVDCRST_MAG75-2291, partial [uncultured Propionibacteriaceae bacterium]